MTILNTYIFKEQRRNYIRTDEKYQTSSCELSVCVQHIYPWDELSLLI